MPIDQAIIWRALDEEDIEGLLRLGAPPDEYEEEARVIADTLARFSPQELVLDRVTTVVADVCSRMFGPFDDEQLRRRQPVYRQVAQRILEAHQQP